MTANSFSSCDSVATPGEVGIRRKAGRPADPDQRERRRAEIVHAAAGHFAEHGYLTADMQELARRAGVAKGTLYHYFATREELFRATVRATVENLTHYLHDSVDPAAPGIDQVVAVMEAYLRFFAEDPTAIELMMLERIHFRSEAITYFQTFDEKMSARWDELATSLIASGQLREMPLGRLQRVVGDLLYGTVFANALSGQKADPVQQTRELVDLMFHGILSASERRVRPPVAFETRDLPDRCRARPSAADPEKKPKEKTDV